MSALPAMKLEEIQLLFAARLDIFNSIWGQPTNTDLKRLRDELIMILLPIPYDVEKGIHNILGLVMDKEYYEQCYYAKFPTTTKTAVYNRMITKTDINMY